MRASDNAHDTLEGASYADTLDFKAVRGKRRSFCDASSTWNAPSTCKNQHRFGTDNVELSSPEFISARAPMPSDGMKSRKSTLDNLLRCVLRLFSRLEYITDGLCLCDDVIILLKIRWR